MTEWRWAAARAAGTSHARNGLPCQDAYAVGMIAGQAGPVFAAIVSDGAGSARFARDGARIVARGIATAAESWFAHRAEAPEDADLVRWIELVRGHITEVAVARRAAPREFAATLVACFALPHATVVAHVGDGACVLDGDDEGWCVGSWPSNGEFANSTSFVTDAGGLDLRVTRLDRPARAVAVFTDGIEDLVLQRAGERAHPAFFDSMFRPVRGSTAIGRDRALSRGLRGFLTGDDLNARTDDDKSLILAVRP